MALQKNKLIYIYLVLKQLMESLCKGLGQKHKKEKTEGAPGLGKTTREQIEQWK